MAGCAAAFLLLGRDMQPADILHWSPANPALAALFLIALYAFKSMSVFFPLVVLYLAGGLLFPLSARSVRRCLMSSQMLSLIRRLGKPLLSIWMKTV